MKFIDDILNKTTMYKLVLYFLIFLFLLAFPLAYFNQLPFSTTELLYSSIFITFVCFITNKIFSFAFDAPTNSESFYITALILILIITPMTSTDPSSYFAFIFWASALSMASKYIFALKKKHIFNPAAISLVITGIIFSAGASWWIGNMYMSPFVFVAGFLIARKIKREDLFLSFIFTYIILILGNNILTNSSISLFKDLSDSILMSPLFFLAGIMLTEPLTTPPTKNMRIIYGVLVAVLALPFLNFFNFSFTPELALVIGNIFSYIVSPKEKLLLSLVEKRLLASDTYEFTFASDGDLAFKPGQYMEFTLAHRSPDNRGNRRYFTIASSPTESDLKLGIKFYPMLSSFKNRLLFLEKDDHIIASQVAGEFVMPKNKNTKLVFIAGGIGVTPFRSMIKYCVDMKENRDIILLYSNKAAEDIAYKKIFDEAVNTLGIKVIYILTDKNSTIADSQTRIGTIDMNLIKKEIPDYMERTFYISGPHGMVASFEDSLNDLNIPSSQIKVDFFPGFA